ncbi:MAG: radical SAM protein [Nitrososphaerota archaeon]
MTKCYDVVFLHPLTSFRKHQVDIPYSITHYPLLPMGIFSLASLLKDKGYDVKIINLGLEQSLTQSLDIENFVKSINSKIYAIDLHWFFHSEGGIQLAEMCKKYHPNSIVILGGFTATWFYEEILSKHNYVDAIALGEAEQSIVRLVNAYLKNQDLSEVPGIAYRENNLIKTTMSSPPPTLDDLNFIELSLLQNWKNYLKIGLEGYNDNNIPLFWVTIARGCIYNCIYCGGCYNSYKLITNRQQPIFRAPQKVVEDILRLQEIGIKRICLSHDPEIAGEKYWSKILQELKKNQIDIEAYWESSQLPSREFLRKMKRLFNEVEVAIYPLSPNEDVRTTAGKKFSNDQFFRTLKICEDLNVASNLYFTVGLPGETISFYEYFKKMIDKLLMYRFCFISPLSIYTVDPSSMMAINPEKYNVKLYLKTFEDYKKMCSSPHIINRIGHETDKLSKEQILELTNKANKYLLMKFYYHGSTYS